MSARYQYSYKTRVKSYHILERPEGIISVINLYITCFSEYNLWYHKTMDDMVNSLKEAKTKSGKLYKWD
jgi:hypothetical protein